MSDLPVPDIAAVRIAKPSAVLDIPIWDGRHVEGETHGSTVSYEVRVIIWPELSTLGLLMRDHGYSTTDTYLLLREWNPQVLLHELLHVALPEQPHAVINRFEVGLAQFFDVKQVSHD